MLQVITKLDMGGAEVVALDLVSALRRDVDFAVASVLDVDPSPVGVAMARQLSDMAIPLFPGARGHFKKGGALQSAWRLAQAVRRFQPDLVHLHTEMPELTWAIAGLLAPGLRKVPVLRTVHNCELWIAWGRIGRWVTGRLAGAQVLAVSRAAAEADAAIPTRRTRPVAEVVYNGVTAPVAAGPDDSYDGGGDDRTGVHVLFAGRLIEQKAPDLLPEILRRAHAATPRRDVCVRIAGAGPLEAALRDALHGIAPGWTVTMTPPIANLSSKLSRFDVVLMPSRYEGFSILAMETLLSGVPLVATRAPGLREAFPDDYPFCAEVDDAAGLGAILAGVIADPEAARQRIAVLVPALAQQFAPDAMIARHAQIYAAAARSPAA
ncbi:glycosyltransferase family 4 protein [Novosphingobium soli]|uniref:Glycosyltransferase family 4 protein n=1 Tax=Novosphingobium soli TaxID=574956 RepID=A0ABV6CWI8_9SPHN